MGADQGLLKCEGDEGGRGGEGRDREIERQRDRETDQGEKNSPFLAFLDHRHRRGEVLRASLPQWVPEGGLRAARESNEHHEHLSFEAAVCQPITHYLIPALDRNEAVFSPP